MGAFDDLANPSAASPAARGAFDDLLPPPAALTRTDRVLQGMRDPFDGGAQLLTKALPTGVVTAGNNLNNWLADKTGLVGRLPEGGVDQQVQENEATYQARRKADAPREIASLITGKAPDPGIDWYRMGGNAASPANIALAMRAPAAASLLGRVAVGGAGGAASAALNPVAGGDFAEEKAKQIGIGAGFGAAAPVAAAAIGRLLSPRASTNPNVQLLRDEGVNPTIGQTLGGWANRAEEKAMSIPIVGDMIAHARDTSRREFNQAAINRATDPIGTRVEGVGQGAVQRAGDAIGDAYDAARAAMGSFRLDRQANQDITRLNNLAANLPEQQQRSFQQAMAAVQTDISPNGTIPAAVFKRIDSKLGQDAAQFMGSSDPYHQQLGQALRELQGAIAGAGRRANPQADDMFRAADRAYANLVRVEGASKGAMNSEGVFTPGQLNSAVRQADQSVRDRATGRGTALMQDLGNAGQTVLGNKVPNSGTADRLMLGSAGLGAGLINPAIPAALLGGAAMYTAPMQRLLRGAVASRPQSAEAIAQALLQASPRLAPGAAQMGLQLLQQPSP